MITSYKDIIHGKDVRIDTNDKIVWVFTDIEDSALYSYVKNQWFKSPVFIKFTFPFTSGVNFNGSVQFLCINEWVVKRDNTNLQ